MWYWSTSPGLLVSWELCVGMGPPGGIRRPGGGWRESSSYIGRLGSQVACSLRPDPPPRETTNSRPLNTQEAQHRLHQAVSEIVPAKHYLKLLWKYFKINLKLKITISYQWNFHKSLFCSCSRNKAWRKWAGPGSKSKILPRKQGKAKERKLSENTWKHENALQKWKWYNEW